MTTINVELSPSGINKTYRALRKLAAELKSGDLNTDMRQAALEILLDELNDNISRITDRDGNLAGVQTILHDPNVSWLRWTGRQVKYLEFGTGTVGLEHGYEGSAMSLMGYQPVDHMWVYFNHETGEITKTRGIPAYAPLYKVYLSADAVLSQGGLKSKLSKIVDQAIQRAFNS